MCDQKAVEHYIVGGKKKGELESIDLFITEECNMSCSYCFHPKAPNVLFIEQGCKILNRIKELSPDRMEINFFGGEPMLYPETVIALAEHARTLWLPDKQKQEIVNFTISTNATFFSTPIFTKMKSLGFSIQISCDGDELTTLEHRGGDFNTVISNSKAILSILPLTSVRMTYTPKTVGRLALSLRFLIEEVGFTRVMHHAVMEADWTKDDVEMYRRQLRQIYHYRRWLKKTGKEIDIHFVDNPLRILNDEIPAEVNFCDAGKSYVALLASGDVFPCHRAASQRLFKLGNIFNREMPFLRGIFTKIDKEFTGCSSHCVCASTCHTCIITQELVNKDLLKPLSKYCAINEVEFNEARGYLPIELSDKMERKVSAIDQRTVTIGGAIVQMYDEIRRPWWKKLLGR